MIIYIHGFGSSGLGGKSLQFREYFKSQNIPFISPSLSYVPQLAIDTLEQIINSYDEEVYLIGSSLGGFYAIYLAEKYGLKAVLVNPVVESTQIVKRALTLNGMAKNYYDNTYFTWNKHHIEMLLNYRRDEIKNGNYLLLLQTADDILDYKEALAKLPHSQTILEEGGTHQFDKIERHFTKIKDFFIKEALVDTK